ncbi:hypothetical protein [Methylocapsa aurea]|uniref:hypothetical protein n=1 Tax=Methylocapsa aurea TaxID=663610 RepID=UPI0005661A51|nr:hypothetical protein [Methylocapsa aurea]
MTDYIPELSELRMVRRAPDGPLPFSKEDKSYVVACFKDVEASFGVSGCAEAAAGEGSARALIKQLIEWWRTLGPETQDQRDAYGRMPGAIRLIDTVATWVEEQDARRRGKADAT